MAMNEDNAPELPLNMFFLTARHVSDLRIQKATGYYHGNVTQVYTSIKIIFRLIRPKIVKYKSKVIWYKAQLEEVDKLLMRGDSHNGKRALHLLEEIDEKLEEDLNIIGLTWGLKKLRPGIKGAFTKELGID